jgi:hypothetical protein
MDALKNRILHTTKALSAQRELLKSVNKFIHQHYCWPEDEETNIQISVVEGHKASHSILLSFLASGLFFFLLKFLTVSPE